VTIITSDLKKRDCPPRWRYRRVRWNIILTFAIKGIFIGLEVLERFGAVEPPGRRWSIQTEVTD
jgi:hypothetical protein